MDSVTQDLREYELNIDRLEKREKRIDAIYQDLMKTDCYWLDYQNFNGAIIEMFEKDSGQDAFVFIKQAMQTSCHQTRLGLLAKAGQELAAFAHQFWSNHAMHRAELSVELEG